MSNNIIIKEKIVIKILKDLNDVLFTCEDENIKEKLNSSILELEKSLNGESRLEISELIYEKMKEFKEKDPDLHFKLYMIYRKLEDGKLSEEDAIHAYKSYFGTLD